MKKTMRLISTYEYLMEHLMESKYPIWCVCELMSILNFVEDGTCVNDSFFLDKEFTNQELRRVLNL